VIVMTQLLVWSIESEANASPFLQNTSQSIAGPGKGIVVAFIIHKLRDATFRNLGGPFVLLENHFELDKVRDRSILSEKNPADVGNSGCDSWRSY
jgi:hypothetical protein